MEGRPTTRPKHTRGAMATGRPRVLPAGDMGWFSHRIGFYENGALPPKYSGLLIAEAGRKVVFELSQARGAANTLERFDFIKGSNFFPLRRDGWSRWSNLRRRLV